jgi:hypothetical protein
LSVTKVTYDGDGSGYLVFDPSGHFSHYFIKGQEVAVPQDLFQWLSGNGHIGKGKLKVIP